MTVYEKVRAFLDGRADAPPRNVTRVVSTTYKARPLPLTAKDTGALSTALVARPKVVGVDTCHGVLIHAFREPSNGSFRHASCVAEMDPYWHITARTGVVLGMEAIAARGYGRALAGRVACPTCVHCGQVIDPPVFDERGRIKVHVYDRWQSRVVYSRLWDDDSARLRFDSDSGCVIRRDMDDDWELRHGWPPPVPK